ncbi:hypothetical protein CRE_01358 [Caenorhabditis remanei]|uniref:Uncharacterized protein n=1 Tax=Caenorhabditis remanei TaxID=31234 RepID=E3ND66_CAERE|nr:hypothetical protein CRE_01358 [Caenorhabditis remanei]
MLNFFEYFLQNKKETRKRRMVTGTLTITDEEKETVKPRPEFSTSSSSSSSSHQQQYCVQKDRIELVVIIVVLLILLQIGLALFFYKKCVARSVMDSSSCVYSEGSSECSATSSAFNTCHRQVQGPVLPQRPARFADGAPFTENPYNRLHHFT